MEEEAHGGGYDDVCPRIEPIDCLGKALIYGVGLNLS